MSAAHRRAVLHMLLTLSLLAGAFAIQPPVATSAAPIGATISIVPDQMAFTGAVITKANAAGTCTEDWLKELPQGGIILGAAPGTCSSAAWSGATATLSVDFPAPAVPTVYVMRVSWPDVSGKGLHSQRLNRTTSITLDGHVLWTKRAIEQSTYNDYYALQHDPLILTIIIREAGAHTIAIKVPAQTAWDIGKIEFIPYAYPTQIHGIGYSPYRDCQYPGGPAPTADEIKEDLFRISHTNNAIRTYASTGVNRQIPALAKGYGLKVFPGAWLDNLTGDEDEIQGLLNIVTIDKVPADGLIVGNEFYLRHRDSASIDKLYNAIVRVKNGQPSGAKIPVTTAEIDNLIFTWKSDSSTEMPEINPAYRKIIEAVDIVMVHIYPFWSGLSIDGAAKFAVDRYLAMQARLNQDYPGKRLVIGETGWPSTGSKPTTSSNAVPGLDNQRRYLTEFLLYANRANVDYLYFDGMDEEWKVLAEGSVGPGWGYSYTDRSAKHAAYGMLVPTSLIFGNSIYLPAISSGALIGANFTWLKPLASLFPSRTTYADTQANEAPTPYYVYSDWGMGPDAGVFIPSPSQNGVSYYACDRTDPAQGEMSIRQTFTPSDAVKWSSTLFLYPEGNAGDKPEGKDLSQYNKLVFQARGQAGGERLEFMVGGIGTQTTAYPDSVRPAASTGFVQLTTSWQTFTIDLHGKDLSHVINGFGWSTTQCANPNGATFYLDDIRFEYDPNMPPVTQPDTFPVYTDAGAPGNHYYPTNWMGDGAAPGFVNLSECWTDNPHSGSTSIRIAYPAKSAAGAWAGIYWVHPQENWGDRPGGYDLTGVKRLTFWARAESPATVSFFLGGVGYGATCSDKLFKYPDSVCPQIRVNEPLTTTWTQYTIDLTTVSPPRYFGRLVGGFGWASDTPVILYLDDIVYAFK